jgi:hypothetical protein
MTSKALGFSLSTATFCTDSCAASSSASFYATPSEGHILALDIRLFLRTGDGV